MKKIVSQTPLYNLNPIATDITTPDGELPAFMNSTKFPLKKASAQYGLNSIAKVGKDNDFVQDYVEWGFQVRRNKGSNDGRKIVVGLALKLERDWISTYSGQRTGVYGFYPGDEKYMAGNWDEGGNLECFPPSTNAPYGVLVHGDTLSVLMTKFLVRQNAQLLNNATVSVPLGHFAHVDEVMMILPPANSSKSFMVVCPDVAAGFELARNSTSAPQVTHGHMYVDTLPWVIKPYDKQVEDEEKNANHNNRVAAIKNAVAFIKGKVAIMNGGVAELPEMTFGHRSFPLSVANVHPTSATHVVRLGTKDDSVDPFALAWKAWYTNAGYTLVSEHNADLAKAWSQGGEVHCATNSIRLPNVKENQ